MPMQAVARWHVSVPKGISSERIRPLLPKNDNSLGGEGGTISGPPY